MRQKEIIYECATCLCKCRTIVDHCTFSHGSDSGDYTRTRMRSIDVADFPPTRTFHAYCFHSGFMIHILGYFIYSQLSVAARSTVPLINFGLNGQSWLAINSRTPTRIRRPLPENIIVGTDRTSITIAQLPQVRPRFRTS